MKIKNKSVIIKDLGVVDYKECWDFQEKLFKNVVDVKIKNRREALNKPTSNYLLFVEHPHVYTLGKSGDMSNLLVSETELIKKMLNSTKLTGVETLHIMDLGKLWAIQY